MTSRFFDRRMGATLVRSGLGLLILKDFIIYFQNRAHLFDKKAIVSYDLYRDIAERFHLQWFFIDFNKEANSYWFCLLGIALSLCLFLGIFKRLAALILFFSLFIFKMRNPYLLDGGDNVILVLLPFLVFTDSFSFFNRYDKWVMRITKKIKPHMRILDKYFSLAIVFQLCIIYFFAGLHKLQSEVWRNGTALYYILESADFHAGFLNDWIAGSRIATAVLTWTTLVFQLSFPFLIWHSRTRLIAVCTGVLFHLGIFFLMRIDNFSFVMLACYAILFEDKAYGKLLNHLGINEMKAL